MRVLLDTNVIIAAFATHGLCHLLYESVAAHHELLMSPAILSEIQDGLTKKLKLPGPRAKEILSFLNDHSVIFEDKANDDLECRDPDDLKIIALAIHSKADVVVTGDRDLLVLKFIANIPILSPRQFWTLLKG